MAMLVPAPRIGKFAGGVTPAQKPTRKPPKARKLVKQMPAKAMQMARGLINR